MCKEDNAQKAVMAEVDKYDTLDAKGLISYPEMPKRL